MRCSTSWGRRRRSRAPRSSSTGRAWVIVIGLFGGKIPFGLGAVPHETHFLSSIWGSRDELAELIALAQRENIEATIETMPLEQAQEAAQPPSGPARPAAGSSSFLSTARAWASPVSATRRPSTLACTPRTRRPARVPSTSSYAPGWVSNLECVGEMPDLGDFLRRLAGFSRLILFDRQGSGLSDRPSTTESPSLELGMDDIRAVMDAARSEGSRAVRLRGRGRTRLASSPRSTPTASRALAWCFRLRSRVPRVAGLPVGLDRRTGARLAATHRGEMGKPRSFWWLITPTCLRGSNKIRSACAPGPGTHVWAASPGHGSRDRADRARARSQGRCSPRCRCPPS